MLLPAYQMIQRQSTSHNNMSTSALTAFHAFLRAAGISIRFNSPVSDDVWSAAMCSRVMTIALRSQEDVLSATYSGWPALQTHITNIDIADEPVPISTA
jgi:hypothetical protein